MTPRQLARFMAKVDQISNGCWLWKAARTAGYGVIGVGRRGEGNEYAHRLSYEHFIGPIPPGLQIDHLCRVRSCVNPAHLEAVTHAENIARGVSLPAKNARKTHCPAGHPYDATNTYIIPSTGSRTCRTCAAERRRAVA